MTVTVLVRKSTETVEQLSADIVRQIPGASVLEIKNLSLDTQDRSCITGQIQSVWDLQKTRNSSHRKLVLQDADGTTINILLYGEFAEEISTARKKDTLVLYNFELEESSQFCTSRHKHQVIVQAGEEVPKLWLITEERTTVHVDTRTKSNQARTYTYAPLGDVQPNTTVDVFGLVKFLKPPKQTKGTDLILILSLIDPSLHENDQKLKCVLFVKPNKVPKIEVGNVVRIHRLKIGTHQGVLQGGTAPGFSIVVFPSPDADPQSSTPNFTYSDEDKKKVKELFEWSSIDDVGVADSTCSLSDIAVGVYFNLVCQVVSTCKIEDGVCFLMQVWDGTKPIYPVRKLDVDTDDCIIQTDPNLARRASDYLHDVCAFDDHFPTASKVKPGMFVKFYNLHAAEYRNSETREDLTALPTVELVLHRGTTYGRGLLILDNQSEEIRKLKTKLDSITPSENPQPSTSRSKDGDKQETKSTAASENVPRHDDAVSARLHDFRTDGEIDTRLTQKTHSAYDDHGKGISAKKRRNAPENGENNGRDGSASNDRQDSRLYSRLDNRTCSANVPNRQNISGTKSRSCLEAEDCGSSIHMAEVQFSCDILGSDFSNEPRCMQETATVILNHPHVKRSTIQDVLQHSVPYKFRVKARILDYHPVPTTATHFIRVFCNKCHFMCRLTDYEEELKESSLGSLDDNSPVRVCPTCQAGHDVELTYMLCLLLHDGSGWLVANLWRAEADKFFKDIPATEARTDPVSFNEVKDFLTHICPADKSSSEKPWIECCVASYTASSGVNYHIFDTVVA